MSAHKSNHSNWTEEQKKDYWERRKRNLSGTPGYANIHQIVKDEKGNDQIVPVGFMSGFVSSRLNKPKDLKGIDRRFTKKGFHGHKTPQEKLALAQGRSGI